MNKRVAAIIVAAGQSSRLPGEVPKAYRKYRDKMLFEHSYEMFKAHPAIGSVLLVINPAHRQHLPEDTDIWTVSGGATRQQSVYHGLDALADDPPDWVLVHDAARPHLNAALIDRVLAELEASPAVIPAIPVKDTIKQADGGHVIATLPRDQLYAVQTPQGFYYTELLAAHLAAAHPDHTDDASVMEAAGVPITLVAGDERNQKITTPADWQTLSGAAPRMAVGQGFDVHQLIADAQRPLMICGVEIPGKLALKGHSDADVGLHALVDALLGALGEGDIGEHFSPNDAQWKNADSAQFVAEAMRLATAHGAQLQHVDITVIAEVPRLSSYKQAMRERVASLLAMLPQQVNIKATTTEGLGFAGRKEGIAAQAVVTIQL